MRKSFAVKSSAEILDDYIKIYPHPVGNNSIIAIQLENEASTAEFIITDIRGCIVKEFNLTANFNHLILSNKDIESGFYIGTVLCNGKRQSLPFIVMQ